MKKLYKITVFLLALVMTMGLGANAFAANTEFDIRRSYVSPDFLQSMNKDSDETADVSKNVDDESKYIREINGEKYDIRRNSAPDSFKSSKSAKRASSTEAASSSTVFTEEKGSSLFRAAMPTGGGEYPYNPSYWNDEANVYRANCYGYMLNRIATDTSDPSAGYIFQPGFVNGDQPSSLTGSKIIAAVKSDMESWGRSIRSSSYSEVPGSNEYKVALVIAPATIFFQGDYHWYRQDSDGGWSHKPGLTNITYKDASDNYISDPQTCDRNYSYANYSTWCGYYIVTK